MSKFEVNKYYLPEDKNIEAVIKCVNIYYELQNKYGTFAIHNYLDSLPVRVNKRIYTDTNGNEYIDAKNGWRFYYNANDEFEPDLRSKQIKELEFKIIF